MFIDKTLWRYTELQKSLGFRRLLKAWYGSDVHVFSDVRAFWYIRFGIFNKTLIIYLQNFRFNHFDLCFSSPGIKNQSDRVQFSPRQFPKCAVISQTTWLLPAGSHVTRAANEITRIGREILDRKSGKSTIISAFSRQTSHRGGPKVSWMNLCEWKVRKCSGFFSFIFKERLVGWY